MSKDQKHEPKKVKSTVDKGDPLADSLAEIVTLEDFQKRRMHNESLRLLGFADLIDDMITSGVSRRHDILDIAGVLAHRLGTLIGQLPPGDREVLHGVCLKVLTEQAQLK